MAMTTAATLISTPMLRCSRLSLTNNRNHMYIDRFKLQKCYVLLCYTAKYKRHRQTPFENESKEKKRKEDNLSIIYTMINLVVQVCNRLAQRACDEYYETARTMRERTKDDRLGAWHRRHKNNGQRCTETVRCSQDMSIYSAIRKKNKGTNKKKRETCARARVTDDEWEMMQSTRANSGYQPA